MQRRSDIELFISAWSPSWLDGSGVVHIAEWYTSSYQGWQPSEIFDIDNNLLSVPLDAVRTSGNAKSRPESSRRPPDVTPVIYELKRLRKKHSGPLEQRIIEYASSLMPCLLGLHAVDIYRPLPEAALAGKRGAQPDSFVRETLDEFRALYAAMPLAWALCSIYGRGPSVPEIYRKSGTRVMLGAVYVSKSVSAKEVTEAFHPARTVDVGSGYEVMVRKQFGGPMDEVPSPIYDGLWKVLRKASITGLPWEILKSFDASP